MSEHENLPSVDQPPLGGTVEDWRTWAQGVAIAGAIAGVAAQHDEQAGQTEQQERQS